MARHKLDGGTMSVCALIERMSGRVCCAGCGAGRWWVATKRAMTDFTASPTCCAAKLAITLRGVTARVNAHHGARARARRHPSALGTGRDYLRDPDFWKESRRALPPVRQPRNTGISPLDCGDQTGHPEGSSAAGTSAASSVSAGAGSAAAYGAGSSSTDQCVRLTNGCPRDWLSGRLSLIEGLGSS
jgi:hypothetical protein